jgi:hypothetical protein
MSFESLINTPMPEAELAHAVAGILRAKHGVLQRVYFFLRLEKVDPNNSKLVWIKAFQNEKDWNDFYWDTQIERANISIKFVDGAYEVLLQGYHYFSCFRIIHDWMVHQGCPGRGDLNLDSRKMIDRKVSEGAFLEISELASRGPVSGPPVFFVKSVADLAQLTVEDLEKVGHDLFPQTSFDQE